MSKVTRVTREELEQHIKNQLFKIWMESVLDDWDNFDIRDLHLMWHSALIKGENE